MFIPIPAASPYRPPPIGGFPPGVLGMPSNIPGSEREPIDICKLFVGGLNPITTEENLEDYMRQFGQVRSATIMFDRKNNRSRCFGFVTFDTEHELLKCFNSGPHTIAGNTVELRRAVPRTTLPPRTAPIRSNNNPVYEESADGDEDRDCKVFIGGIPHSMTPEDIKAFFSERFGAVKQVDFFYDKATGRMRGFGFLIFNFAHSAKAAIGHHNIGDITVEVKRAVERDEIRHVRKDSDNINSEELIPSDSRPSNKRHTRNNPYKMYNPPGNIPMPLQDPYASYQNFDPSGYMNPMDPGLYPPGNIYTPPFNNNNAFENAPIDPYETQQPTFVRGRQKPNNRANPY